MAKTTPSPPYPKEKATKIIKEIVAKSRSNSEYSLIYTDHFRDELSDDNLDINDAHYILQTGVILEEPEYEHNEWRYRIQGKPIDSNSKVFLVVSFENSQKIVLITIFRKKGKK